MRNQPPRRLPPQPSLYMLEVVLTSPWLMTSLCLSMSAFLLASVPLLVLETRTLAPHMSTQNVFRFKLTSQSTRLLSLIPYKYRSD